MKKRMLTIMTVLLFVMMLPVSAVQDRSVKVVPTLTFSGTTATCTVSVVGNSDADEITVDVELCQGDTVVKSWEAFGAGTVDTSKSVSVTKGETYTLKAYATINGVNQPMAYVTKTC